MSSNEARSVEEGMEGSEGCGTIDKKECEEFFDCVEEQPQEVRSLTYNVINKGVLSFKYSMSGASYLSFAASYATYFASYIPFGISYATDFAKNVSSCASSYLDKSEKGYEKNITDQGILGLKYSIDGITYTMRGASCVLRGISHSMCSASYILDSTSKALYNKSSALNKENIDYVCTTADEYVDGFNNKVGIVLSGLADSSVQISNKVGTMLNSVASSAQKVFPQIPMVV